MIKFSPRLIKVLIYLLIALTIISTTVLFLVNPDDLGYYTHFFPAYFSLCVLAAFATALFGRIARMEPNRKEHLEEMEEGMMQNYNEMTEVILERNDTVHDLLCDSEI